MAAQAIPVNSMLREKKLKSLSIRIGETLHDYLESKAREGGFNSVSEYVIHRATEPESFQAEIGTTLQHSVRQLRQALCLVEMEPDALNAHQKLYVFDKITSFQRTLLAGRKAS